jgi:hypothetical protein
MLRPLSVLSLLILFAIITSPRNAISQPIAPPPWSQQMEAAAENGDTGSQFTLAEKYLWGQDVKQDYAKAAEWFQKVTEAKLDASAVADLWGPRQRLSYAQTELGKLYEQGQGVPQDYKKAAALYREAIKTANEYAQEPQWRLGHLYEEGIGVDRNDAAAIALYTHAALSCGYWPPLEGKSALGRLYLKGGPALTPNYEEAYFWLHLAKKATISSSPGSIDLSPLIDEATRHLSPEKIAELDKRSLPKGQAECITAVP